MSDTDTAEGGQDLEAPEEEVDADQALLHFGKYSEARRALPWAQWTFKEKANFFIDRIFLGLMVICFLLLIGEFVFKIWYVTDWKAIAVFVSDSVMFLSDWLFSQERQEELLEF